MGGGQTFGYPSLDLYGSLGGLNGGFHTGGLGSKTSGPELTPAGSGPVLRPQVGPRFLGLFGFQCFAGASDLWDLGF